MLKVDLYFTIVKPMCIHHKNVICRSDYMYCAYKSTNGIFVIFSIISKLEDYIRGKYLARHTL